MKPVRRRVAGVAAAAGEHYGEALPQRVWGGIRRNEGDDKQRARHVERILAARAGLSPFTVSSGTSQLCVCTVGTADTLTGHTAAAAWATPRSHARIHLRHNFPSQWPERP